MPPLPLPPRTPELNALFPSHIEANPLCSPPTPRTPRGLYSESPLTVQQYLSNSTSSPFMLSRSSSLCPTTPIPSDHFYEFPENLRCAVPRSLTPYSPLHRERRNLNGPRRRSSIYNLSARSLTQCPPIEVDVDRQKWESTLVVDQPDDYDLEMEVMAALPPLERDEDDKDDGNGTATRSGPDDDDSANEGQPEDEELVLNKENVPILAMCQQLRNERFAMKYMKSLDRIKVTEQKLREKAAATEQRESGNHSVKGVDGGNRRNLQFGDLPRFEGPNLNSFEPHSGPMRSAVVSDCGNNKENEYDFNPNRYGDTRGAREHSRSQREWNGHGQWQNGRYREQYGLSIVSDCEFHHRDDFGDRYRFGNGSIMGIATAPRWTADNPFAAASSKRRSLGIDERERIRSGSRRRSSSSRSCWDSGYLQHSEPPFFGLSPSPSSMLSLNGRCDPFSFPMDSNMIDFNVRTESVDEGDDGDIDIDDEETAMSMMVDVVAMTMTTKSMADKEKDIESNQESDDESDAEPATRNLNDHKRISARTEPKGN